LVAIGMRTDMTSGGNVTGGDKPVKAAAVASAVDVTTVVRVSVRQSRDTPTCRRPLHTQTTSFCSTHCDRPRRCCHLANNFDSSQIFPILHNGPKIAPSHKEDPGPHRTRDHATSAAIGRFYALRACMRCGLIIFTTQCI